MTAAEIAHNAHRDLFQSRWRGRWSEPNSSAEKPVGTPLARLTRVGCVAPDTGNVCWRLPGSLLFHDRHDARAERARPSRADGSLPARRAPIRGAVRAPALPRIRPRALGDERSCDHRSRHAAAPVPLAFSPLGPHGRVRPGSSASSWSLKLIRIESGASRSSRVC